MFVLSILTLGLAAATSVALPAAKRAAPGPWCDGLGFGAFDNQNNFTLAAWNSTGINANTTGAPLVLGQAGAVDGAEFKVLSTFASYPFNQYPSLSLVNGRLIPQSDDTVPAAGLAVTNGSEVSFIASASTNSSNGPQIYCAVADTDPAGHGTGHPFLAVNGDTDSFALCQDGTQNNIVWKQAANQGYDLASCYAVKVQLIYSD